MAVLGISLTIHGWEQGNGEPTFVLGLMLLACGWLSALVYVATMRAEVLVRTYRTGYKHGRCDSAKAMHDADVWMSGHR
jgi:hypothetical protein